MTKEYAEPMRCGHCGNTTPMELAADFRKVYEKKHIGESGYPEFYEEEIIWKLLLCPVCCNLTLLKGCNKDHYELDYSDYEVLYPTWGKPILGLPDDVALEYQSACIVRNVDSNAFGVLIGRVIDKVCIDRGAEGKTLFERLKSLTEKGEIPERLCEIAHNLRKLRNIAAHAELGKLTEAELPVLDDLCRAVLEYVYAAPKLIEQVEQRLQELENSIKEEEEVEGMDEIEADDDIPF